MLLWCELYLFATALILMTFTNLIKIKCMLEKQVVRIDGKLLGP